MSRDGHVAQGLVFAAMSAKVGLFGNSVWFIGTIWRERDPAVRVAVSDPELEQTDGEDRSAVPFPLSRGQVGGTISTQQEGRVRIQSSVGPFGGTTDGGQASVFPTSFGYSYFECYDNVVLLTSPLAFAQLVTGKTSFEVKMLHLH